MNILVISNDDSSVEKNYSPKVQNWIANLWFFPETNGLNFLILLVIVRDGTLGLKMFKRLIKQYWVESDY